MMMLPKEQVTKMARAYMRHFPRQDKLRGVSVENRLREPHAEAGGAVDFATRNLRSRAQPGTNSRKASHFETADDTSNRIAVPSTGGVICPAALNSEVGEAHICIAPELCSDSCGPSSGIAPGTSMFDFSHRENVIGGAVERRDGTSTQSLTGNQSFTDSPFAEMIWTKDMRPTSQNRSNLGPKKIERRGWQCDVAVELVQNTGLTRSR
jgi:hypothetical protein